MTALNRLDIDPDEFSREDAMAEPLNSKFFRVATEGATTDGRTIKREWIDQMAQSYDPKKYGARVWLEHYRGALPDSPFRAYGDVLAIKAEDVEDGKRALFAQISPTGDLIQMNQARQKIYSSVEINPNFADTGAAYLMGLAVTDSPASIGTEMLAFCSKQHKDNVITPSVETKIEFESEEKAFDSNSFFRSLMGLFSGLMAEQNAPPAKPAATPVASEPAPESMKQLAGFAQIVGNALDENAKAVAEFKAEMSSLSAEVRRQGEAQEKLTAQLSNTPASPARPPATGGNSAVVTDC